jgi:putative acetyltransferase
LAFDIRRGDFSDPQVIALLRYHFEQNRANSPPDSCHVLDLSAMQVPEIAFFTLWEGVELLGMGALKRLSAAEGELKSMRTKPSALRRGVAGAILRHLIAEAGRSGFESLWLETGSYDYFAPARALYARHGFVECAPFGDYQHDPNSAFMMRALG